VIDSYYVIFRAKEREGALPTVGIPQCHSEHLYGEEIGFNTCVWWYEYTSCCDACVFVMILDGKYA
jgi:hypothetical protein